MKLTGPQLKEVNDALLEAFDRDSLEQMLLFSLNKSLDRMTMAGSLTSIVFDLVRLAQREGWLPQLLVEAHLWVPNNERLAAVALSLASASTAAAPPEAGAAVAPVAATATTLAPLPHIDPDDPPYGALRRLLRESFNPASLHAFCQERRPFRPVLASFGSGHGLEDMIDRVLDHCRMYLLWNELVAGVAEVNPAQVGRFADEITRP